MTEERYDRLQQDFLDEAAGVRRFHTIDGETMMDKQIAPLEFVVAEILPYGTTVLAGPSKAGKSFFPLPPALPHPAPIRTAPPPRRNPRGPGCR